MLTAPYRSGKDGNGKKERETDMIMKHQMLTELYGDTVRSVTNSGKQWMRFLEVASHNYQLPFDQLLLIFAQRPDALAVMEMEQWNRRYGRLIMRGAKGIAVFDSARPGKIRYYFSITDTQEAGFQDHSQAGG